MMTEIEIAGEQNEAAAMHLKPTHKGESPGYLGFRGSLKGKFT